MVPWRYAGPSSRCAGTCCPRRTRSHSIWSYTASRFIVPEPLERLIVNKLSSIIQRTNSKLLPLYFFFAICLLLNHKINASQAEQMESSIISSPAVGQTIAANTLAENAVAEYLLEITAEGEISPGKDSPPHRFSSNGVIRLTPKTEPNGEVTYEGWGERAIVIEPLGQCGMLHSGHGSEYVVVTGTIKSLAQASVVIRPDHREYVTGFRGDISMIPCLCPKPCNPPFKFQDHGGPLHIRMMTTESKGKSP